VNNINEKRAFFLAERVSLVDQACNTFKAHLPYPVRLTWLPRRRQAVVFTSAPIPRSWWPDELSVGKESVVDAVFQTLEKLKPSIYGLAS